MFSFCFEAFLSTTGCPERGAGQYVLQERYGTGTIHYANLYLLAMMIVLRGAIV